MITSCGFGALSRVDRSISRSPVFVRSSMPTRPTVPSGRVTFVPLRMQTLDMLACMAIRRGIMMLEGVSSADKIMTEPGFRGVLA